MIKSFFKFLLLAIFLTILVIIAGLFAAPHFVRQDQIKAFLQDKVKLPEGKVVEIKGKVDFGIYPLSFVKFNDGRIVSVEGDITEIKSFYFSFNFHDLFSQSIRFDLDTIYDGIHYVGNLEIEDYRGFIKNNKSLLFGEFSKPAAVKYETIATLLPDEKIFEDIIVSHKQTQLTGDLNVKQVGASQELKGSFVLDSQNIEDLRRLVDFENYNNEFDNVAGVGKVVVSFHTKGADDFQLKRNLNAEGSLQFSDLLIYGYDVREIFESKGKMLFTETTKKAIAFDDITGSFKVSKGVLSFRETELKGNELNVIAKGDVDIAEESLAVTGDALINYKDEMHNIPFKLKGSFDDVQASLDFSKMIQNNLGGLINKGSDKLKEKISKDKNIKKAIDDIEKTLGSDVESFINILGN